jgi:hypothetical protein
MPVSASTGNVQVPALALMPDGRPVVSWTEGAPYAGLTYTSVWDGCAWQLLGDPAHANSSALLVTPAGQIIRATVRYVSVNASLLIERWNGTSFEAMGDPIQPLHVDVGTPAMVADPDGNPFLAWVDAPQSLNFNSTAQVAHWNGSTWISLSDPSGVLGGRVITTRLSMALTPAGQPVLAWPTTGYASVVAQFVSGTTWTKLGTPPAATLGSGTDHGPLVRINSAGTVFLAWETRVGALPYVAVSQYDGASWHSLGGPLVSAGAEEGYDMAIDQQGLPLVADSEYVVSGPGAPLFTYHWDGSIWQAPAPAGSVAGSMYVVRPNVLIDPLGRIVAGWIVPNNQGIGPFVVVRFDP